MKRGISLIVLVITIIIIIILAGAVILNLADNNPIDSAEKSKIMSDLDSFNSDLTIQIGQKYLKDYSLKSEDIDSDESRDGWKLLDLVPSMKGTGYEEYLAVVDSKLVLKEGTKIDEITKEIIEERLGEAIITPDMIKADAQKYIGAEVKYTGYSETTNDITWKIFNVTENGTIQLIANDYVNLSNKTVPEGIQIDNSYNIHGLKDDDKTDREILLNYLKNTSNWSEYAVSGKTTVKGAPTIEEFCSSYKLKYPAEYFECEYTTAGSKQYVAEGAVANGYVIKSSTATATNPWVTSKEIADDIFYINKGSDKASGYWLASPSVMSNFNIVTILNNNSNVAKISYTSRSNEDNGVRPVVTLTSNASIVKDADGKLAVN